MKPKPENRNPSPITNTKKKKAPSTRKLTTELQRLAIVRKEIEGIIKEQTGKKASEMLLATLEENKNSIEQKMLDITQKIYG